MKSTIPLLLLWACNALSEPLGAALQRRSDRFGVYASDYAKEYRKASYVAIPLHMPVPVLHVMSSAPLFRGTRGVQHHSPAMYEEPRVYAASMSHGWFARPRPRRPEVDETSPELIYAQQNPRVRVIHGLGSAPQPENFHTPSNPKIRIIQGLDSATEPDIIHARPSPTVRVIHGVESAPPPEIIYARPNPQGGYTYSKRPTKKRAPARPEPLVVRVHKTRIVRER